MQRWALWNAIIKIFWYLESDTLLIVPWIQCMTPREIAGTVIGTECGEQGSQDYCPRIP